jgi:hypothetical protein
MQCPYCIDGNHFKLMTERWDGAWRKCSCGHVAMPGDKHFQCFCPKCIDLRRTYPKATH